MRILIGCDGSACARLTLGDLERAGLPPDADVLVLSVVDAFLPPEGRRADAVLPRLAAIRADVRDAMRSRYDVAAEAAAQLRARFPGWAVHSEACADSPAWAIVKRAEGVEGGVGGEPADLVVVGSHDKSALQRLMLGSVSLKVLTHVRCSVRIARPRARVATPPRIVIGVDGSPDSRAAVDAVAARAWPDATRVLIAAFEQGAEMGIEAAALWDAPPHGGEASAAAGSFAEHAAAAAAEILRRRAGLAVETLVEPGDPKQGLLERARSFGEEGADCIFVGARGLRGIERFLLGSVSTRIATHAPCSVEVVRPGRQERG